jgi:hypothetical protein
MTRDNWENRVEQEAIIDTESSFKEEDVDLVLGNELGERVSMDDFADVYGKDEIDRDKAEVERIERGFQKKLEEKPFDEQDEKVKKMRRGEALEAVFRDHIESKNWFGNEAVFVRSSRYDDLKNGVDGYVEFAVDGESGEIIALAIDVSMSSKIEQKVDRNVRKVLGDERSEIKYFEPQTSTQYPKGKLENVIPLVIGVDGRHSSEVFNSSAQLLKLEKNAESAESKNLRATLEASRDAKWQELEEHPAQVIFIKEVRVQLLMYERILDGNEERADVLSRVRKAREIVEDILESKKDIDAEDMQDDAVLDGIKSADDKYSKPNEDVAELMANK